MFESDTILMTVQQAKRGNTGTIPREWRVFRATNPRFLPSGIVATMLTVVLFFLVSGLSKAIDGSYLNFGLILAIALLVGVLVGLMVWMRNRNALLIITRDGFVQQTHVRTSIAVSYAQLEHMDIHVKSGPGTWLWQHLPAMQLDYTDMDVKSRSAPGYTSSVRSLKIQGEVTELKLPGRERQSYICATNIKIQGDVTELKLTLRYPDGHEVVWRPAKVFGPTLDIVPYINEGYVQYSALKRRQMEKPTPDRV